MDGLIYSGLEALPTLALVLVAAGTLFLLGKGADLLVDEAVRLSLRWGVPKMVVGATIVSLGTTLPEATVSVLAAANGNPDLAMGNAIGSIIADTGLIIGLAALIGYLPVDRMVVQRQGKVQLAAGCLLAVVSILTFSNGQGHISRWMGWIFIGLLAAYIAFSVRWAKNPLPAAGDALREEKKAPPAEDVPAEEKKPAIFQMLKLAGGIALVVGASKLLIPTVEITAVRIGIPQGVIAATLVAFGTSLPELVTAITAVRKGHGELAVGNIVGADILNVLFVVGSAASVTAGGLAVPADFYKLQIPVMLIVLVAFRLFSIGKKGRIGKTAGLTLLGIYVAYIVLNYTWLG